jgi:phage repressor protein C with HTH and peptisase S24 domain
MRKPPGEHPRILLDRTLLYGLGQSRENWLVAHRIDDDSMAPTLNEGDLVLIDTADFREHLRDGIYAIENGNRLFVKRLAINPVSLRVTVLSDNSAYTSVAECEQSEVHIIGRVVWHSRII